MSALIDGTSYVGFEGTLAQAAQQVESLRQVGEDYFTYRLLGRQEQPSNIRTTAFAADESAAETLRDAQKALEGSIVSVTTPLGETIPRVLIHRVDARIQAIVTPVGDGVTGTETRAVLSQWTMARLP